ncbi:hypothetical protein IGI37_000760 [Enterococcus sp. AZ194]|uniref:ABC transporter ATP-binding protein/permease n=1 Tax=Enterococcus sp. AZ194 TaxID=2774629 RepID=UPI003F24D69A
MKLEFKELSKSYGTNPIFSRVSNVFNHHGEITAIVGESGTGKSTLLNILFGIDQKYEGTYLIDGKDTRKFDDSQWDDLRSREIQMVYQDFKLLENFSVDANLYFANRLFDSDYEARKDQLLNLLNLNSVKDTVVKNCSGGQKQRVAIARALLNRPKVILLDEPTGNLDSENTTELMDYLQTIKDQGISIYIITHDDRVLPYSDNIYRLANQQLIEEKSQPNSPFDDCISQQHTEKKTPISVLFKYVFTDLRKTVGELFLTGIPLLVILSIFMLLFTGYKQLSLDSFTQLFKGLDETVIYVETNTLTNDYANKLNKQQINSSTDGHRLFFSEADINDIEHITEVKKTIPFDSSSSIVDEESNELQQHISAADFPDELKKLSSYSSAPDVVNFTFQSLFLSSENIDYYNPNHIKLASGSLPQKKDELLVPDFYLVYLQAKNEFGRDGRVSLDVKNDQDKFTKKSYVISGSYVTDYRRTLIPTMRLSGTNAFAVYTRKIKDTGLSNQLSKNTYEDAKNFSGDNEETTKYLADIYKDYDSYKKSVGTGIGGLLIVAKDKKDMPKLSEKIQKLFPYYQLRSRYALTQGDFALIYHQLLWVMFAGLLGMVILMVLIFVFLNKQNIHHKKKELAILFSLGYSKRAVKFIIGWEITLQLAAIYLSSLGVVALFNKLYLSTSSYGTYFTGLFDSDTQLMLLGAILVTCLLSTLWGVTSVKKKKLIENLK